MKSLRFALRNYQLSGILYIQELVLFLLLFVPFYAWLWQETTSNYFAYRFSVDFFGEVLGRSRAMAPFLVLTVLVVLSFILLRIFLMGGIFESLLNQYSGMRRFLFDAAHHFKRFLLLFLCYSIPLLIGTVVVSKGLGAIAKHSPNQMMPVYTAATSRVLAIVLSIVFSYWHTAARYRTVIEEQFRVTFRIKAHLFARFFGYQFLSVLTLSAAMLGGLLMLSSSGIIPWLGFLLIQAGLIARDILKVASYKVLS